MNTKQEGNTSIYETLAREFERWQKEYYDEVDVHFAKQDKARGSVAFNAWEQRFFAFLEQTTPSLVSIYQNTVRNHSVSYYFGTPVHQSWKHSKGERIEAFLTQSIQDARARRLVTTKLAQSNTISSSADIPIAHGKVFIGHGNSNAWKDLKEFIQERLKLQWDEFNREPTAGISTKERLEEMLDQANFAFLILTAEDEHPNGTFHPRENVIHEAGLFQGRLGFKRAILLVEESCTEFSNIKGLTQIRFPKGNILAKSEDIRRVLEREGVLN